ncbi:PLD1_2 [Lepeophtheirus salmonis]|uniref:phospholipase D n=1 Tax=Lepeophtheirus salmonis TaxID=72036 RepID=A0A7R8D3J7_LEPSM|nr:PLD1_2 [Lepeophtheirus salmonis]CAF2966936.1 PLD1_2 [Lepeophtheirus salmonis]
MPYFWKSSQSVDEEVEEFRRKSVRLRDGDFLHGELRVEIVEANDLPDTDNFLFNIKRCFGQEKDVTDPYVTVYLDSTRIISTSVIYNNLHPQWNEYFRVMVCHHAKKLLFRVKDQDEISSELIGEIVISVKDLLYKPGMRYQGWMDVLDSNRKVNGQLYVKVVYQPCVREILPSDIDRACRDCYFTLKSGNRVTLYSCARNIDSRISIPGTTNDSQIDYYPSSLWIDLFKSIVGATKFIYIMGWSINTKIKLLRGDDWKKLSTPEEVDLSNLSLGELLLNKADSGVRVLVMIWGETTAIMGTHDTETVNFFKGTRVFVAKVGRQTRAREYKDLDARLTTNLGYSHHQKGVILDASGSKCQPITKAGPRRIIAYTGGIDLTDGRYDTPSHSLYRTLQDVHLEDFYQPCEPNIKSNTGPRLPWQDIHCKIEGPAARDIMINFVERWGKELPDNSRLLIQNVEYPDYDIKDVPCLHESDSWKVQVFRSITSDGARFQLENETSFTTKKGRSVDNSIPMDGWMIRMSIATMLFQWKLQRKICDAISNGKRFTVYIVVPLHPEGIPTDSAIQEMLYWQKQTMQMMYTRIAQALHTAKRLGDSYPTDYLMFFCLGKKERRFDVPPTECPLNSRAKKLRKSRRLMIYVHSKLMIVDDSYLITGSANINQRSLDGDRDSELAVGIFQPGAVISESKEGKEDILSPKGEIFKFRMSLFQEHLSRMEASFTEPWTEKCSRSIRESAVQNWKDYEDKNGDPEGHLLIYPIQFNVNVRDDTPVVTFIRYD